MKNTTLILILMVLNNIGFSQTRKIDIPMNQMNDTIYFYTIHENQTKQLGLENLYNDYDSLNFRFWSDYQVLDFKISKGNEISCELYNFVWKAPAKGELRDYKNRELVFNKTLIHTDTAKLLWNKAKDFGLLEMPTDSKINGWTQGFDGITYITEYSTDSIYKYCTYWTPNVQPDSVLEAKSVQDFYKYTDSTIGLFKSFQDFTNKLSIDRYSYGNVMVEKIKTKRKKRKK